MDMKINYKKSLKLVTLLVTAVLIATASATTYKYMYLNGTVNIGTQQLVWISDGSQVSGNAVSDALDVEPGILTAINYTLYLKNQDTTDHNLTITVITAAEAAKFDLCKMYIYMNDTGSYVNTLDLTQLNDQHTTYPTNSSLAAGKIYRLDYEIQAKAGESGNPTFKLEVKYE